jgi:flagellar basal-body rod modification protein FlgD
MSEIGQALPPALAKLSEPAEKPHGPRGAMGKDDFMKLLMAQLQNQDPLKPMDHQEFAAQLAQFSSLESLTNINKSIDGLHSGFGEEAKLQAVGMIGKKVQASGNEVELIKGENVTIDGNLPEDVVPTKVVIYNPDGQLVRQMELAGSQSNKQIIWDGKDENGSSLPSGKYKFTVHGVGMNGESREGASTVSGLVTGVEMEGKTPVLLVQTPSGKSKIEWAKVGQINMDDTPPQGQKTTTAMLPRKVINEESQPRELIAENAAEDMGDNARPPTISEVPWEQLTQTNPMTNFRP